MRVLFVLPLLVAFALGRPENLASRQPELKYHEGVSPRALTEPTNIKSKSEQTKEILAKIAEVNQAHGFNNQKGLKAFDYDSRAKDVGGRAFSYNDEVFKNPIIEYLKNNNNESPNYLTRVSEDKTSNEAIFDENTEQVPKGITIKRRITHHQSYMVPNPMYQGQFGGNTLTPLTPLTLPHEMPYTPFDPSTSQQSVNPSYINNFNQPQNQYNPALMAHLAGNQLPAERQEYLINFLRSQLKDPNAKIDPEVLKRLGASRQWQWPFSNFFPIVINDPFLSLFNAFSSVVEYGPEADICKKVSNIFRPKNKTRSEEPSPFTARTAKGLNINVAKENLKMSEVEDLDNPDTTEINDTNEETQTEEDDVSIESLSIVDSNEQKFKGRSNEETSQEKPMDEDSEKKFWHKETPGSGIYIKKLKVRQGGVAVAGPGGIATAGSGGTAIVGPNGLAYTQPNGVAIAGPGARVVAVPAGYNLTELILNTHGNSGEPRELPEGSHIVAVGPTVYYNRLH